MDNLTIPRHAMTALLIATVVATNFLPVTPEHLKPYVGALVGTLAGLAALFHIPVPPK